MQGTLGWLGCAFGGLFALVATPLHADDLQDAMQSYLQDEVLPWAQNEVLIGAVVAQNNRTSGLSEAQIVSLDQQWRSEISKTERPTIAPVLNSAAADFLRDHLENSAGMITEVFVMDAVGLNVAASGVTSDFWQGDESKFTESYGQGVGAVHFGEVEFDESSQMYQAQVSITLADPKTGQLVGAMTIGLNAGRLM